MRLEGQPPRVARRLLLALLPPGEGFSELVADLDEEFAGLSLTAPSATRARRWYWSQALRSLPFLIRFRLGGTLSLGGYAEVGAALLATFFAGGAALSWLPAGWEAVSPWRPAAAAGVLVAATAVGARVGLRRRRGHDPMATSFVAALIALGLGFVVLGFCPRPVLAVAWLAWLLSSSLGAAVGMFCKRLA